MGDSLTPLVDKVILRRLNPVEEITAGGILIPATYQKRAQECEVVVTGKRRVRSGALVEMSVQSGDRVLLGETGGRDFELDGEKLTMAYEEEIMAVLQ